MSRLPRPSVDPTTSIETSTAIPVNTLLSTTPIRVRLTLSQGRPRAAGVRTQPYLWSDLLDGAPPRRKARGAAPYVVDDGAEDATDVHLSYATSVRVDAGEAEADPTDDAILVEERITVQRRALEGLMDRERGFSDRLTLAWRAKLATRHARHRYALRNVRTQWLANVLLAIVQIEARVGDLLIKGTRGFLRGAVSIPDRILTQTGMVALSLTSRSGRRDLRIALLDPSKATVQEKSLMLFISTVLIVFFILVASNVIALGFTSAAPHYQRVVADFSASLLSILALPIPTEPLLIFSVLAFGPIVGSLGHLAGKLVGSWMLYLLGDTLADQVEAKTAKRPRLKRVTDWMRSRADKHGFWLLGMINAIPFIPDTLVYVFAVSGMRYRSYFGGILVGTLVKFGLIIAGIYVLGPDRVQEILQHPIASLRGA